MTARAVNVEPGSFAICRLPADASIPDWAQSTGWLSMTRTGDELSIVCRAQLVPPSVQAVAGWACLKVVGPLDFALTGILASLATPLAEANISLFAISTYDTDYLLVRERDLPAAIFALEASKDWKVTRST